MVSSFGRSQQGAIRHHVLANVRLRVTYATNISRSPARTELLPPLRAGVPVNGSSGRLAASLKSLLTAALSALTLLAFAQSALAASFTVRNDNDSGASSLRQAITGANTNGNPGTVDRINFDLPLSGGTTIATNGLDVNEPVTINGCSERPNNAGPCVGVRGTSIDGESGEPRDRGLRVFADKVSIRGLALTNYASAIASGGTELSVANDWFGTKLDGGAEANVFGVNLFRGDLAAIGGTSGANGSSPATRNVFSYNKAVGVRITGDDRTLIRGNYFGTSPSGGLVAGGTAGNGENIEVAGEYDSNDKAIGTVIGGRVSATQAASTRCDGTCNVISLARGGDNGDRGIDLDREFAPGRLAAGRTTIAGNYIGLGPSGGGEGWGNSGTGINVGRADNVTIGGSERGDRNYTSGNQTGIRSGAGATALVIRNNFLGLHPAGDVDPDRVYAARMAGGLFERNRLAGIESPPRPSAGGLQLDPGVATTVRANTFGLGSRDGSDFGLHGGAIRVFSDDNVIGGTNPGEGNVIGNMRGSFSAGIGISNGRRNSVLGNLIGTNAAGANLANDGAGIAIGDTLSDGNRIGGDTRASENVVSNSYNAIVVAGDGADNNLIARNRGRGNGGLFIDLDPFSGSGNNPATGPNGGVQEPAVSSATPQKASGTADPGATVRVFRTTAAFGRIDAFLGQTTATAAGKWSLTYPAPIATDQFVGATQTPAGTRNTSELTTAATAQP